MFVPAGQSIEIVLGEAHSTAAMDAMATIEEFDGGRLVDEVSVRATSNGTTPVTLVSDPNPNDRVISGLSVYNTDTVDHVLYVNHVIGGTIRRLSRSKVPVSGTLSYARPKRVDGGNRPPWEVHDPRSGVQVGAASPGYHPYFMMAPIRAIVSSLAGFDDGSPACVFAGVCRAPITEANVQYRITANNAGAITWSEIFVASGRQMLSSGGFAPDGQVPLKFHGYISNAGQVPTIGSYTTGWFSLSSPPPIGADLYVGMGGVAAAVTTVRGFTAHNTFTMVFGQSTASVLRPSTAIGNIWQAEPADATVQPHFILSVR